MRRDSKLISAFAPILSPSQVPWGIKAFSTYLGEDKASWKEWDASELIKNSSACRPFLLRKELEDEFYPESIR